MAGQVSAIARTQANAAGLVHDNFVNEVVPWVGHMAPKSQLFSKKAPPQYTLVGTKLVFSAEHTYGQMAHSGTGWLPDNQDFYPVELNTTPTRNYQRIAMDNFVEAFAKKPGAYADFAARKAEQLWNSFERWETFNIQAGSDMILCLANAARSGGGNDTLVVKDGYGVSGVAPTMFIEPGHRIAVLDTSAANAVLGAYTVSSVTHDTSASTATIVFTTAISATIAAGDKLVGCTSTDTAAENFETSYTRGPLGTQNLLDPSNSATTYLGVTEASYPRINPIRMTSSDFGPTELVTFLRKIEAKSQMPVSVETHTLVAQGHVEKLLAEQLLPFQQMQQMGKTLEGGYTTVRVAGYDFVFDGHNVPGIVEAWCLEDCFWIDLDGDAEVVALDGSAWSRIPNYDGREQYAKKYGQRIMIRRNRSGVLSGIDTTDSNLYDARPA